MEKTDRTDDRNKEGRTTPAVDYNKLVEERAQHVFDVMQSRSSAEDMVRLRDAFEFAKEAHAPQKRRSGEPYILHPIAVADIAASEINLDVNSVIAAFLHDVVEDTPHSIDEIQQRYGDDVAFLVRALTKQKKEKYEMSKQLDNFKQMLNSVQYDIRALLVKLSDRLHNMRTLSSMRTDKQMKIAGETDYFYAPLATRLGLYDVKTELENLSLRFRCPQEYAELERRIKDDELANREKLRIFIDEISVLLSSNGIKARVFYDYRRPYSLWRKMHKYGDDFDHLKYRHFVEIVFKEQEGVSEKETVLRIYSLLTDRFKEKPGGISNYIDSPKENGYQSFHLKLLADYGRWEEVHICSERMVRNSRFGCLSDRSEGNIRRWINKFRGVLKDIAQHGQDGTNFIENVVASFYNDDIMTFTPEGKPIIMPQKATPIDFAYEIHSELGRHAKYCRINGRLASIKQPLHRGDIVEIFTDPECHPEEDWLDHSVSYKARRAITSYLSKQKKPEFERCDHCHPIPGEEVIGFKNPDGTITVHKRDCSVAIRLASQQGDNIVAVNYRPDETKYPIELIITCIDRPHMIIDIMDCISNQLSLSVESLNTATTDSIVTLKIRLGVHDYTEIQTITAAIKAIPDVEEVRAITLN
ncbi:MAG: bifunctional (p)ppGpp synthetase/guanosine-3',5'-bis(diphosphate) 3'-pyrophosphohydrolase [Bacteroides sp.]|nr:bifunctional (p)ppGpp synthetase/guanosine-3',5'-bis(diphosphate) 3'-pyrophosphohydrolase [Bacteroidales bacterium]MBD5295652.1 bifunctional (p)ppGpp synthetase/guanosine-3',5'-bis(diphosphate) 3'-pyrophosphohydrolase [Bacteroides sp.]